MKYRKEPVLSVCETPRSGPASPKRVTRPPTADPELPSLGSALPPLICRKAGGHGGREGEVTPRRKNNVLSRWVLVSSKQKSPYLKIMDTSCHSKLADIHNKKSETHSCT